MGIKPSKHKTTNCINMEKGGWGVGLGEQKKGAKALAHQEIDRN
jgi:hypothetical protein